MRSILSFELNYYIKNFSEVIYFVGLFICIVVLAPFGQAKGLDQALSVDILWVATIVAIALYGANLFERDYQSGRLEVFQLVPHLSLEGVVFAKWFACWLAVIIPLLIILPVVGVLLNIATGDWPHLALGLASGSLCLSLIMALAAIITVGHSRAKSVLNLLMLPLTIPVIIFGAEYLNTPQTMIQPSLLFLWGFSALLLPILCIAGASCIRASN